MIISGERAYIYAKICGIIGKSFIGKRTSALSSINRLADLDRLIFPGSSRELPERELLPDLEKRLSQKTVQEIINVIDCFKEPPRLLNLLVRAYEYADLKTTLSAITAREPKAPAKTNIGHFGTINFKAYPDLKKMLKGTEFGFLLENINEDDTGSSAFLQSRIDRHYYEELWKALEELPKNDRIGAEKIIGEEIILRNIAWALRLRTYYNMPTEKVRGLLIFIQGKDSLTAPALQSLNFALDTEADWAKWKWAKFVNTEKTGNYWKLDPRYFQNKASAYLYNSARLALRARPFTLDTVYCFVRLKQAEEDTLTSIAEGFGFNMTSRESLNLLGEIC